MLVISQIRPDDTRSHKTMYFPKYILKRPNIVSALSRITCILQVKYRVAHWICDLVRNLLQLHKRATKPVESCRSVLPSLKNIRRVKSGLQRCHADWLFQLGGIFCHYYPDIAVYRNWGGSESGKSCRKTLFGGRCRWWLWILVPSALSVGVESCCCFAFLPVIALVYNHAFDVIHFILRLNASVILWLAAEVLWEIKQKKVDWPIVKT